jgi:Leucine-rich repeat (LRR) protein
MTLRYLDPRLALAVDAAQADTSGPLTRLAASDLNIRRLGGIEQLTSLRELDLAHNPIASVIELGALTELRRLTLARTLVPSLRGLEGLPALVDLSVHAGAVAKLDALAGLGLRSLDLRGCPVRDLDPVASMTRLEALSFGQVTTAVDGAFLTRYNARAFDLAPLRALDRLRKLHVGGVALDDARVLDALVTLEELILDSCEFGDRLINLPALPRVELLVVRDCRDLRLEAVAQLPRLRELVLDHVELDDLSPLLGCATLERVRLLETELGDRRSLDQLREHPNLVELHTTTFHELLR